MIIKIKSAKDFVEYETLIRGVSPRLPEKVLSRLSAMLSTGDYDPDKDGYIVVVLGLSDKDAFNLFNSSWELVDWEITEFLATSDCYECTYLPNNQFCLSVFMSTSIVRANLESIRRNIQNNLK